MKIKILILLMIAGLSASAQFTNFNPYGVQKANSGDSLRLVGSASGQYLNVPTTKMLRSAITSSAYTAGYGMSLVGQQFRVDTTYIASKYYLDSKTGLTISDNSIKAIPFSGNSFTIIGDSFTESAGASSYVNGYSYKLMRSVMNAADRSYPRNRGFGYHTIINAANSTSGTGISTTGSYLTSGTVQSRLQLTSGQTVTVSNRSFNYFDVFYDASASSGSLEFRINGSLVATKTLSGSGIQNTFPTIINTVTTKSSDVVTMTATGTAVILGIETLRAAQDVPLCYVIAKSGFGLQDFNTPTAMDEIAKYVNFTSGNKKYFAIALGTNNIYQPERALTPAEYINNLASLINGINSRCGSVQYFVTVPAKSNESIFPVIKSGFTYQNYVDAIVAYCKQNKHVAIRYDLTQLGTGSTVYLADNIHPNDEGHLILGGAWASALSIPYDFSSQKDDIPYTLQDVTINGYSAIANAAVSTENIQIGNSSSDSERFININGFGNNKYYGYKLGGNYRMYENTGGSGTSIEPKDAELSIIGKTTISSNSDVFLAKTNSESVLAQLENTGGHNSLLRLKTTAGFSDIQKNMDGSLSFDIDDAMKLNLNTSGLQTIGSLSSSALIGSGDRPVFAGSDGTLKIGDLSGYQTVSNLSSDLTASSTKYPSVNAVNTGLSSKENTLTAINGVSKTGNNIGLGGDGSWLYSNYAVIAGGANKGYLELNQGSAFLGYSNSSNLKTGFYANPSGNSLEAWDDVSKKGLSYKAKYRSGLNNRWIPDKEYVDSLTLNYSASKANLNGGNTFSGVQVLINGSVQSLSGFTDSGFINTLQAGQLTTNVNTYLPQDGGQLVNSAYVGKKQLLTASGNGSATTISIAHNMTGITSSSWVSAIANNAASAGIQYVTVDATNVNIFYTVAPVSGTNNLLYSIEVKQ